MLKNLKMKVILTALVLMCSSLASAAPFGGAEMEIEGNQLQKNLNQISNQDEKWNVWGNFYGGKVEQDFGMGTNKFFPSGVKSNYNGIQVGLDKKVGENFRVGGFVGYTDFDGEFKDNRGDMNSYSSYLGVYGVYQKSENGFYANGAARVGSMKHELDASIAARTNNTNIMVPIKDDDHSTNWSLSLAAGQRFFVKDKEKKKQGFYVEPQASVLVGHVGGTEFETITVGLVPNRNAGVKAAMDGKNLGYLNLGTLIGYEVKKGKNPINIYGKVGLVYDFGDEQAIDGDLTFYNRSTGAPLAAGARGSVETEMSNHWWVFGMGVSTKVKDRHTLHFDIETTTGGDTDKNWQLSAGYKFAW